MNGWRRATAVGVLCAVVSACAVVPDDESVEIIDRDKVPYRLAVEASSTSTTAAPPPTSAEPSTTITVTTTPDAITAISPGEPVRLYFVAGDELTEVVRSSPTTPAMSELVTMLSAGPFDGETATFARTALEHGDVGGLYLRAGTLTVDMTRKFRDLPSAEQRRAIAQLVLTYTRQAGVGQVRFTSEGRLFDVPRSNGTFGTGPLSRDDYTSLIATTTTTSSSTTSTTSTVAKRRKAR